MKKLFAIFGDPVGHSKSPLMHNLCFEHFGVDACYMRICLKDPNLLRDKFFLLGLSGANITVPHKQRAFTICDEIDNSAKDIGAVNTIINSGGKLKGYNTDTLGFMMAVKEFSKQKVLILGAGGTAKAIAHIMVQKGYDVTVVNRSAKRLEAFGFCKSYDWNSFKQAQKYDLIINTTSAGLSDETLPIQKEVLVELFKSAQGAVDVVYGKTTPFLQLAKDCKIAHKDGADMLLYQGVIAHSHFIGKRFSQSEITKVMQKAFVL